MTEQTTSSPLRRTAAALARTAAAGSLAGLAVAAFAAPAHAGDAPDGGFTPPYAALDTVDNRDMSVRITGPFQAPYDVTLGGPTADNRDFSVRITGSGLDNRDMKLAPENRDMSADPDDKIWIDAPDNRDFSVRITGDGTDNRDFSVRITDDSGFTPPYSVRITGAGTDNRDMGAEPDNRDM